MTKLTLHMLAACALIAGCAGEATPRAAPPERLTPAAAMDSGNVRLYVANLTPVNRQLTGGAVLGAATIAARNGQVGVTLKLRGLSDGPHITMIQGFADSYRSGECPTPQADRDGNAIIDALEASRTAGTRLIGLNTGMHELDFDAAYPSARGARLSFERWVSERTLLAALIARHRLANRDGSTRPYPLAERRNIPFEDYTIVVYGVPADTHVPDAEWLHVIPQRSAHASLPVACGAFSRIR
jgi:hypothetical protein